MINFNSSPYYSDFDESKKFVRILFRPSFPVQARELTNMQVQLQNQLGRLGEHIFSPGSVVIDGQTSFENKAVSIKITDNTLDYSANIANFFTYFSIDTSKVSLSYLKTLIVSQGYLANRNGVSGLVFSNGNAQFKVIAVYPTIDIGNPTTVICQQMTGVTALDNTTYTATATGKTFTSISSSSVNPASFLSMNDGVFFVNDLFVFVERQTVITSKYTNTPTIRVGLSINESIVTSDQDQSLLDPASGTTNYNAPGADRYAIDLVLSTKAVDNTNAVNNASGLNYIDLVRLNNGIITDKVISSTYSDLEDTLARRTYDEAGDYTVTPFGIQFRDHPSDTTKFQVGMGAGVAYVRGYEFRTISTTWLDVDRARTTATVANEVIPTLYGNWVLIDTSSGTYTGALPVLNEDPVQLWNNISGGSQVGTARVRLVYRISATQYRIYLTDVNMSSGSFSSVRTMKYTGGVQWDISLTSGNAVLNDATTNTLIFTQPYSNVNTYSGKTFNYIKTFTVSSGTWTGTGPYTASALSPSSGESFTVADSSTAFGPYTVIDSTGTIRTITAITIGGGGTVTIVISAGSGAPGNCTVYAPTLRSTSSPRIKTLNTNTITATAGVGLTNFNLVSGSRNYYDAMSLVSIFHSAAPSTDIKTKFKLNGGQTDNLYGLASITWTDPGSIPTTGTFAVTFKSFDHSNDASGTGYFSVDSYTNVTYDQIPVYVSSVTGNIYLMSDVIDFRPTISDTLSAVTVKNQALPIPIGIGAEFVTTYSYYLPRRDKIVLSKDKKFIVSEGISSLQPVYPPDLSDAMTLYTMDVPAYTFSSNSITTTYFENKRYTMRDIGKIDKRVTNVEYYTALSLLEKQANDKGLLNSVGVNAFKNGILVDAFAGHSVGDVNNPEYLCAIDYTNQYLRPKFESRNYSFDYVSGGTLSSANTVTLTYSTGTWIDQPVASTVINVNPYDVVNWSGSVQLTPSSDSWYDTTAAPDIIQNVSGSNDNYSALGSKATGTVWGDWNTTWTGVPDASVYPPTVINHDISTNIVNGVVVGFTALTNLVSSKVTLGSQQTQVRTGIQTSVIDLGSSTTVGSSVINTSIIPFMRQISVAFTAIGLKPFTQVYTYFDDTQVNSLTTMTTDAVGSISNSFTIPANIRTGTRLFLITDKAPLGTVTTTSARTQFTSSGILQTTQSTRKVEIVQSKVEQTRNVVSNTVIVNDYSDPLAQAFLVNARDFPNGLFLSSVQVYFATKAAALPVTLHIRTMANGFPSPNIIPLSTVSLSPSSVTLASNILAPATTDATTFTFNAPVYLAPGEYCFVLMADTTEYEVYMASVGDKQLGGDNIIGTPPYAGAMFKSQNAATWVTTQGANLMFRINKCTFSTSATDILLTNDPDTQTDVYHYNLTKLIPTTQEFSTANIAWGFEGIPTGGSLESSYTPININTDVTLLQEYQIEGDLANQLKYKATMTTIDANISPVIDLDRCSSILVRNIINTDITNETVAKIGNAVAKYETRKVTLTPGFESVGLNVTFDAYLPGIANVYVYYKAANTGNQVDFDNLGWTLIPATTQLPLDRLDTNLSYVEYNFKTPSVLPIFNLYSIKIVMTGDSSHYPTIKDLRVTAFE